MRMWMVDPKGMCRKHLLGEHGEIHKHRPSFVKKHSIAGRVGQIEPMAMKSRHDELSKEMVRRGYNHQSPYRMPSLAYLGLMKCMAVNKAVSRAELWSRCPECKRRHNEKVK